MLRSQVDYQDIHQTESSPLSSRRRREKEHTNDRIFLHEHYSAIPNYSTRTMGRKNGYDDVPTADLEDGIGESSDDNFSDEGSISGENPGLVRTAERGSLRGNYESVTTNNAYIPRTPSFGSCFGCASVLCQTVVVVTAMLLIATMGFLVGSANPDLMVVTLNNTAGIDLTQVGSNSNSGAASVAGTIQEIDNLDSIDTKVDTAKKFSSKVRYDANAVLANGIDGGLGNPFDSPPKNSGSIFMTPPHPFSTGSSYGDDVAPVGFLKSPHLVGERLVFLSEGDAYVTTLNENIAIPASKVTTTIGNVIDPKWHPTLPLLAYTATYSGRRDIYLMDLSPNAVNKSPTRLTYWDVGSGGVSGVIGWIKTGEGNGEHANALVFRALSNDVSLRDYRLYILHLSNNPSIRPESSSEDSSAVLEIEPVPLAQAMDAARFQKCWYFVRVKQSSHTIRYVGGTAENLWKYCDSTDPGSSSSQPLFLDDNYRGTSKSPQLYNGAKGQKYLFFLSDRGHDGKSKTEWIPDRMNIWALPLKENDSNDNSAISYSTKDLIQITDTECDFEGRTIREYSIDEATGNLVVRIGADLYFMLGNAIQSKIEKRQRFLEEGDDQETEQEKAVENTKPPAKYFYNFESPETVSRNINEKGVDHFSGESTDLKRLPIVVYSDFQSDQERMVPVDIMDHFTSGDVYNALTGSTQMLMTLRGQLWVAPVTDDDVPLYNDASSNLPARRYRVAPGAMMGGSTRILAVVHVPNPIEDSKSDRRLAVILATDPLTPTGEHAFYLVETQASASPLFVDMDQLPKPFLGGTVSGGSTRDGGLGSVKDDTLVISPCGNRMAWSDTDGRIVVMNLPQYQNLDSGDVNYIVLPKKNELNEPMIGDDVKLVFSPGGRYLAIEHHAKNRFRIISIADLGDPLGEENKIADISLGRIVQGTPSRFNSVDPYWGKTPADIHDFDTKQTLSTLLDLDKPDNVATTLYFLSDRDILTDVTNPWGYRQRMPHFLTSFAVYAFHSNQRKWKDLGRDNFAVMEQRNYKWTRC